MHVSGSSCIALLSRSFSLSGKFPLLNVYQSLQNEKKKNKISEYVTVLTAFDSKSEFVLQFQWKKRSCVRTLAVFCSEDSNQESREVQRQKAA